MTRPDMSISVKAFMQPGIRSHVKFNRIPTKNVERIHRA
jgi:hypothetical protein